MRNEKAQQRDQLIREFGVLFQPFDELAKRATPPTPQEYRTAVAKVYAGERVWRQGTAAFGRFADDVAFCSEADFLAHIPEQFRLWLGGLLTSCGAMQPEQFHQLFRKKLAATNELFFERLGHIPFEWEPQLFEANTPFTSYLRVREALAVVNTRLYYFDRYLHEDFFPLFLRTVPRTVEVRLVTTRGNADYGVQHVMPVSDLVRQEFKNYQLIQVNAADIHDRNLWVDDQNFTLGPGTARAGFALTNFGPADSSPKARQDLEAVIGRGMVVHQS